MLGVQRTSVTSAALGLKKQGYIEYHRGVIVIKDRDGLERASCECYGTNAHYRRVNETMLRPLG